MGRGGNKTYPRGTAALSFFRPLPAATPPFLDHRRQDRREKRAIKWQKPHTPLEREAGRLSVLAMDFVHKGWGFPGAYRARTPGGMSCQVIGTLRRDARPTLRGGDDEDPTVDVRTGRGAVGSPCCNY